MARAQQNTGTPALALPQSDDAADALLAEYGELFNRLACIQADLDAALQAAKASAEARAKPSQERMNAIFDALNLYAAAHRSRLTDDGKTKTVALPAGEIGWRMNPAKVSFRKGMKAEDIVFAIDEAFGAVRGPSRDAIALRTRFKALIRIKREPNKEAMLADPEAAKLVDGIKIGSSGEMFYVVPFGAELSEPKP